MTRISVPTALLAAALGIVAIAPKASAADWDKKTVITVSEPIAVPGVTLQPGTYVFRLMDVAGDRHVVLIQNKNLNETFAMILAVPNYRLQPTDKSRFAFGEAPSGQPMPLRAWFYPGDNFGQEFVYPNENYRAGLTRQ